MFMVGAAGLAAFQYPTIMMVYLMLLAVRVVIRFGRFVPIGSLASPSQTALLVYFADDELMVPLKENVVLFSS